MNNYTNQGLILERLKTEWHKHGKIIVAYDFDNTIYDCHGLDLDLTSTILALALTHRLGNEVYCITSNEDHELVKNHSLKMLNFVPKINECSLAKPFYSILLDDRAGLNTTLRTLNQLNFYIQEQK